MKKGAPHHAPFFDTLDYPTKECYNVRKGQAGQGKMPLILADKTVQTAARPDKKKNEAQISNMKKIYLDVLIADDIRTGIEQNKYPENSKLPSEKELCEMYHVQKMTIRSSLQILKDEGRIYSKNKSGYYVQKQRIVKNLRYFRSTTSLVESMGKEKESLLLEFRKIPCDKRISQRMKLNIGTDLYCLERLRKVDNAPVSLEWSYIIAEYFPGLENFDLSGRSLYRIYEDEYQVNIDRAEMQISVVYADAEEARLLEVEEGEALIREEGRTYDYTNRFVEYTETFMRIDRFQFIK